MDRLFMGIDIGTSGIRAAIFDPAGKEIGFSYKEYPMICLQPGMAELDPEVIFNSMIYVVKRSMEQYDVKKENIAAISFSTQLFSFLAVDGKGRCLTNLITWADTRAIEYSNMISREFDCSRLYNITGCRAQHPMHPLSKIIWLKATEPELYKRVYKFITIKEYIFFKLFKKFVIDITDASTTGCFNINSFDWDSYILNDVLGVEKDKFGEPVECTMIFKGMDTEYAGQMGLAPETKVVIGSGDGMLANVGCGVFDDTSMSSTIGTSGALRIAVDKPLLDRDQRTWCYCFTKNTWVAGGAINNGGIVLKWLRDEYKKQFDIEAEEAGIHSVYKLFDQYAAEIKPGSDGLIFLPFLTGERSPGWRADARGTIHGFQLIHGRKHLMRASMEGVMYRMFSIYEIITEYSNVKQVMANGGYVKSPLWLQIQADIFGKEIAIAGIEEAAVFGAAYLAMAAVGEISNMTTLLPAMKPQKIIEPICDNVPVYKDMFEQSKKLYNTLYNNYGK